MSRYKMVVLSKPVPGREAEYNDWYQTVHFDQVLALPGLKSAQRFRLARSLAEGGAHPYLAIYEIETDDLDEFMRALLNVAGTEQMIISAALDSNDVCAAIYEELGPAAKK